MRPVQIHTHVEAPRTPSRIDVHEHRAPTVESAKFLSELEASAMKKIEASIKLDHSLFDCRVFVMRESGINNDIKFVMFYRLGPNPTPGRELDYASMTRVEHEVQLWRSPTIHQIVAGLIRTLSESIANTMLTTCGDSLLRSMHEMGIKG